MKMTDLASEPMSPLAREEELMRGLRASGLPTPPGMRLTVAGSKLLVDGFVASLEQKFETERMCRQLAPGSLVINRLRVAAGQELAVL